MRKFLEVGGFIAGAVLVLFGAVVIALGIGARSTVNSGLSAEKITGTPDMTPALIKTEVAKAGLTGVSIPSCSVAGKSITTGTTARCFAQYMRIHTLMATGGLTYAEMGRFATADGKPLGTNDATKAVQQNGQPVANSARDIWVTETALTTALNVSYMASQLSLFSIVIGVALLLAGFGFAILDWAALHRRKEAKVGAEAARPLQKGTPAVA
jgi:hypothetical protein